jgi:hypothetical protein
MEIAFIGVIILNIVYETQIIIMNNYGRAQLHCNSTKFMFQIKI